MMGSPRPELRALPLDQVPPWVHYEFCRVMDVLSDRDWTRFASRVLDDTTNVRLLTKKEHRTDALMLHWQNRNGSVGQLLDLLQSLELLQAWGVLNHWACLPSPPVVLPVPAAPPSGLRPPLRVPPTDPPEAPPTLPYSPSQMNQLLPKPQPPEHSALSQLSVASLPRPLVASAPAAGGGVSLCTSGVMAWAYEEVHAGTSGFCPALKVGEGGFGEVYRANLRNTDCAVKRFKQDSSLDWSLLRDSFQTEVEKLSKFRHPNIVDLLGYSEGGGTFCLIYSFMENSSLDDQLRHGGGLSWSQRVSIAKGAATALQYLHCPPEGQTELVHGDVKSSNILLDRHLEAKLADFGLAQFCPRGAPGRSAVQTGSFGASQQIRGTAAYLPHNYLTGRCKLGPGVDVYSFGVVLLEVLTGRRALEKDSRTGRDVFLKELVEEQDSVAWRTQLDPRLVSGGAAEPTGYMQVLTLAQKCLQVKKRPSMTEVFKSLDKLHTSLTPPSSSPSSSPASLPSRLDSSASSRPAPPRSLDSCLSALSLKSPNPGHSSLSPPQTLQSSACPAPGPALGPAPDSAPSWLSGPCETDESRGHSQYDLCSNGVSLGPFRYEAEHPSVPTEDHFPQCTSPDESYLPDSERSPAESRQPEESDELAFM